jgi:plasmid stability protein
MVSVPTLNIRNVPADAVETLRERARREGRSLNAEVVAILTDAAERERRSGDAVRRLRELANEIALPPDAPRPEELIREARDAR